MFHNAKQFAHSPNGIGGGGGISVPSVSMIGGSGGGTGIFGSMGGASASSDSPVPTDANTGRVTRESEVCVVPSTNFLNSFSESTCCFSSLM